MDSHQNASSEINLKRILQKDVISLLSMNIIFYGIKNHVVKEFNKDKVKIVWYADNFVIFEKSLHNVQKAKKIVEFLKPIGLRSSEKRLVLDIWEKLNSEPQNQLVWIFFFTIFDRLRVQNTGK